MKGDISRQTFDQRKHYNKVLMQQGRVQLDADWNEQQDILLHRIETQARDIIGKSGVPERGAGFEISFTPDGRDLQISSGRIYVDGILCELDEGTFVPVEIVAPDRLLVEDWIVDGREFELGQWIELCDEKQQLDGFFQITKVDPEGQLLTLATDQTKFNLSKFENAVAPRVRRLVTYTTQPDYPNPDFTREASDTGLRELDLKDEYYLLLIYLDVWQRHVTAFDDPHIREVALNGPDTTTRVQNVWQVKILPIAPGAELMKKIQEDAAKAEQLKKLQAVGSTSSESQTSQRIRAITAELEGLRREIVGAFSTFACDTPCTEWDTLTSGTTGTLNARTYSSDAPENPGYQRLENQLYRVEVHQGNWKGYQSDKDDTRPLMPTYKWARNNASLLAPVDVKDNIVTIHGTGQSSIVNYFSRGQFVEVVTDQTELNAQAGTLAKITDIDTVASQLTLDVTLPAGNNGDGSNAIIRLWDGIGDIDTHDEWLPLDGGIEVQFSDGTYKNGDYWLIPARTITREIEWPPYQVPNMSPLAQLPHGIQHHYCRLARVRRYKAPGYKPVSVRDCRRHFSPLLSAEAMHITWINWDNDVKYTRHALKTDGLQIILDGPPDPLSVTPGTLVVTLEPALPGGGEGIFVMHGDIEVKGNTIFWHWLGEEKEGAIARLFEKVDKLISELEETQPHLLRVRVTLKGHAIWRDLNTTDRLMYLDGKTFGVSGSDPYRERRRIQLLFPSGSGMRASDFESWFYLRE